MEHLASALCFSRVRVLLQCLAVRRYALLLLLLLHCLACTGTWSMFISSRALLHTLCCSCSGILLILVSYHTFRLLEEWVIFCAYGFLLFGGHPAEAPTSFASCKRHSRRYSCSKSSGVPLAECEALVQPAVLLFHVYTRSNWYLYSR